MRLLIFLCRKILRIVAKATDPDSGDRGIALNKEGCLQLRFDVRFLFGVLFYRMDTSPLLPQCQALIHQLRDFGVSVDFVADSSVTKQLYHDVLSSLQHQMDAIDFAFYEPFILSAVERSIARVRVLFGLLFDSLSVVSRKYDESPESPSLMRWTRERAPGPGCGAGCGAEGISMTSLTSCCFEQRN